MKTSHILMLATIFLALTSAIGADRDLPRGAKELFYDPGSDETLAFDPTPPRQVPYEEVSEDGRVKTSSSLGLIYWIELVEKDGGPGRRVTEGRVFRTGEAIRLHFMSNRDGRISLLQIGSSGRSSMLFPDPGKGLIDTALFARRERILPQESDWYRFDDRVGEEKILAVFAADQEQLDYTLRPEARGGTLIASAPTGSKDLVLEIETETASDRGTYAVNTAGQPIILEIVLKHE